MNVHHLQLFYYVARYGGVCPAVRNMPYGIQQPSVSAQLRRLEQDLGKKLFQRRPFELTAAGVELYAFVKPFFEGVEPLLAALRGRKPQVVRLGGVPMILREYLPSLLKPLWLRFPHLRLSLMEGPQGQVEKWFDAGEIDLAFMEVHNPRPAGCHVQSLCKLPIVLLVNEQSSIQSAEDLCKIGGPDEPLIGPWPDLAPEQSLPGMPRRALDWRGLIEVNSLELVQHYVQEGLGVGISIMVPDQQFAPGLRVVPLPGDPRIEVGALWRDALHPAAEFLLNEMLAEAQVLQAMAS